MEFKPKIVIALLLLSAAALNGEEQTVEVSTLSLDQALERIATAVAKDAEGIALSCDSDLKNATDNALRNISSSQKPLFDRVRQIVEASDNPAQKAEEANAKLKALTEEKIQNSISENGCDDEALRARRRGWRKRLSKVGRAAGSFMTDTAIEVAGNLLTEFALGRGSQE